MKKNEMESEATILIIDDEQNFLDTITHILKNKNYNLLQAINGKMGCKVAEKFLPDIIITDWEMPEMNGIETIEYLKSQEKTKDIPIIMASGIMTSSENLEMALQAGAVDYIRKPIDAIELIARINSALKLVRSYKKIADQRDELQELNATKDKFFSIIAHDLRAPIGNLSSSLSLITENSPSLNKQNLDNLLSVLSQAAQTTFELLNNLLTWARSQMGEIEYKPIFDNLKHIIEWNVQLFEPTANNKNVTINNTINENLLTTFDYDMINTIVRNLLNNALKYTHEGGLITIVAAQTDNDISISVCDDGIGMEKEIAEKLFRLDVKIHSKDGTKGEKGTGLGLILCKEFIEKHEGKISIESELDKGSQITFTLPKTI